MFASKIRTASRWRKRSRECTAGKTGYDLTKHRSRSIAGLPDVDFDFVATMGCDACPFVRARRREDWEIPDPKNLPPDEFRAIRDLIEAKVKALLPALV